VGIVLCSAFTHACCPSARSLAVQQMRHLLGWGGGDNNVMCSALTPACCFSARSLAERTDAALVGVVGWGGDNSVMLHRCVMPAYLYIGSVVWVGFRCFVVFLRTISHLVCFSETCFFHLKYVRCMLRYIMFLCTHAQEISSFARRTSLRHAMRTKLMRHRSSYVKSKNAKN